MSANTISLLGLLAKIKCGLSVVLHQGARSADLSGHAKDFKPRTTRSHNHLWKENFWK